MTNNIIKISGSIGLVILQKDKKKIFIFYDDHSNIKYCNNNDIFIHDIFEQIHNNNNNTLILLEEPFINDYSKIKFLWSDIPHITLFRKFYKKIINKCTNKKICYTFPIDIRLCLVDVSLDELYDNINDSNYFNDYNISVNDYFKFIYYLFDTENINSNNIIDTNIIFIKKVFSIFKDCIYYIKLKEKLNFIIDKFIKHNSNIKIHDFIKKNKSVLYEYCKGYPFTNNNLNNFQDQYDKLLNGIMEFYTFILIYGLNYQNYIVNAGYYHANNLEYILTKFYKFNKIFSIGNTDNIESKNSNEITSCLHIDKNILISNLT